MQSKWLSFYKKVSIHVQRRHEIPLVLFFSQLQILQTSRSRCCQILLTCKLAASKFCRKSYTQIFYRLVKYALDDKQKDCVFVTPGTPQKTPQHLVDHYARWIIIICIINHRQPNNLTSIMPTLVQSILLNDGSLSAGSYANTIAVKFVVKNCSMLILATYLKTACVWFFIGSHYNSCAIDLSLSSGWSQIWNVIVWRYEVIPGWI